MKLYVFLTLAALASGCGPLWLERKPTTPADPSNPESVADIHRICRETHRLNRGQAEQCVVDAVREKGIALPTRERTVVAAPYVARVRYQRWLQTTRAYCEG